MVEIIWPDGSITQGPTWEAVLEKVRRRQWSKFGHWTFRIELAKRAKIWKGDRVAVLGTDAEFGRRLGEAGLFMVVIDEEKAA